MKNKLTPKYGRKIIVGLRNVNVWKVDVYKRNIISWVVKKKNVNPHIIIRENGF